MAEKVALIAGASGLVGGLCLNLLLDSTVYSRVIALVRRKIAIEHPRLMQRIVDFDDLPPLRLFRPVDVFCALGTTLKKAGSEAAFRRVDFEYPRAIAERAIQAGARQFVLVSSAGAAAHSPNVYLRTKGQLEVAIGRLPFAAVHIFQPGFLAGERVEQRRGETLAIRAVRSVERALVGPLRKYRPVDAADVAAAMVAATDAADPGCHVYRYDEILRMARREIRMEVQLGR
jgi:uncharacterized protein YbjT (DUF2867 family)